MASKQEEELRRLTVESRLLEQTAEALQSRLNMINAALTDLSYAEMAREGLEKEKENVEILVPIGASSYVRARLEGTEKLIVGVGAGVSIEKTMAETREIINRRKEELEKARSSLSQQFTQVVDKANENRNKFEALVAEMQREKPAQNV